MKISGKEFLILISFFSLGFAITFFILEALYSIPTVSGIFLIISFLGCSFYIEQYSLEEIAAESFLG